jgi:hypothetical protein
MIIRERGYYIFYPSQNWYFPISSKKEINIVKNLYNNRTEEDIQEYENYIKC